MMKPTYTIAIAAIFMVAAFAGIAMVDDEADAVDAEAITSVAYSDGVNSRVVAVSGESIDIMSVTEAFGDDITKTLKYWVSTSGITYSADDTVLVANINAADVIDGRFVLTAVYNATTVDFIVDGKVVKEDTPAGEPLKVTEVPEIADKDGFTFAGWDWSGDDSDKVYTSAEVAELTVAVGQTFTAKFQEVYDVYWVVNGIITDSCDTKEGVVAPADPIQENYTFVGWYDANGVKYTVDDPKTENVDEGYKVTANTTFTAKFEPVNLNVTLITGDKSVTQIAAYGEVYAKPALDAGYAYWATKVVEQVTGEDGTVTENVKYVEFDFSKPLKENVTLYAIAAEEVPDTNLYVTFNIEGVTYGPYVVSERFSIPQTDREGYNFLGWTVEGGDGTKLTSAQVQNYEYTEDVTFVAVYEVAEPPAPEEPAFYETSMGQIAIVIVIFAILAFGYGVYSNAFGLKDKLFGYTIQKKEKKE